MCFNLYRDRMCPAVRGFAAAAVLLIGLIVSAGFSWQCGAAQAGDADLILHHGQIVTGDAGFQIAEAMAVKGDRILAVGSNAEVTCHAGPRTTQIDLAGKSVLPGLIDSHVHPTDAAMYEFDHPIPEMDTVADVLQYIASRAAALNKGDWIRVRQVFITRLRDQRYPTRQELDAAAPDHPVLFATGPDASLNSLALKLSGIDKNFKVRDGGPCFIERDAATGEPTGILRNCTRFVADKTVGRQPMDTDRERRLKLLLADYNSVGLTSIADRNTSDAALGLYERMNDRGELTCRVFASYAVDAQSPLDQIAARIEKAATHRLHTYNSGVWLRGVKVFLDGGMLTGSAYLPQPWGVSSMYSITDPDYRGLLFIKPERLVEIARLALTHDLQMTAHAVGDGAVHALIDAYAQLNREFPVAPRRPCITHANFMSREAIAAMKELGIVADLQPAWLYLDGRTLLDQFGQDRLRWFQPYKTLFEEGVVVGGGSDHMQKIGSLRAVNPYNPFLGMWVAVTRTSRRTDQVVHAEQRLSREQALRLYTINNALLTFEEKEKGSLEPGKLADFIVISRDYLSCPVDAIKDIVVEKTYLGGLQVYPAKRG